MRKKLILLVLLLAAVFLAGCDSQVIIRWDQPIIIEIPYRSTVDGYISYDSWSNRVMVTESVNRRSSYRSLDDARITLVETGQVTYTDRYGYFAMRGIAGPDRYITLRIEHRRLREPVYTSIYLK